MELVTLDTRTCYQALRIRDARFDGRFFTGVTTTGVFCRPVCPARTPLLRNCRFFAHAAAAQEAGYRPCLRCRPEAAPGTSPWLGTSTTVARGLRLIGVGQLGARGVHIEVRIPGMVNISAAAQPAAQIIADPDCRGAAAGDVDIRAGTWHILGLIITRTADAYILLLKLTICNLQIAGAGDLY